MTSTSKRWWDNTTDFLNPFNDAKPEKKPVESDWWSERNKPKEEPKGMFSWMRGEEKKEKEIKTVNDFLSLPMPY
jgi:hypothetical protein